jgi:hypothetical protein
VPNLQSDRQHTQEDSGGKKHQTVLVARQWPSPPLSTRSTPIPSRPSSNPTTLLAQSLIDTLRKTKGPGYQLQDLGSYFDLLPARIGEDAALDASIDCILHGHRSLLRQETIASPENIRRYVNAISLLRQGITKQESRKRKASSEIICAAITLGWFEVSSSNLHYLWSYWIIDRFSYTMRLWHGFLMRVVLQR